MENLNMNAIEKVVKKNGNLKLVKTRVAAIMLAATTMLTVGGVQAQAANVTMDTITITQDGYITEQDYTSNYLSDREAKIVKDMMAKIDAEYQKFYNLMANGLFNNLDSDACIARLIATTNAIKANYQSQIKNYGYSAKNTVDKYLTTKENEAKALFMSVTNIENKAIKDYQKNYDCVFGTNVQGTGTAVLVYKNGSNMSERVINFNDSKLATSKALIKMPTMDVLSTTGGRIEFYVKYDAVIVESAYVENIQKIINEAETLYDKVEKALNKGDYTKKYNEVMEDVFITFNGDLNLISSTLESKYAAYPEIMKTVRKYMTYRVTELTSKVYKKNMNSAKYMDFVNYASANTPIRNYESNGYVYYNLGTNNLYRAKDEGYVTTAGLSADGSSMNGLKPTQPSKPVDPNSATIKVAVGMNLYYNDFRYYPKDASGKVVEPFVYNGTTYLPVRPIAGLCNYDVAWDGTTNTVRLTSKTGSKNVQTSQDKTVVKTKSIDQTITVDTNVRVFVDGVEIVLRDGLGNIIKPLVWNGTTYLPIRALANSVGLAVYYDATNNVVFLGEHYQKEQPSNPSTPVNPSISNREYIIGTKNGVQYEIYFDDNGFYLYVDGKFVPTDISQYTFEEVKSR